MPDPNPKPGVLRNLRIKRVALCDMGANFDKRTGDGAHIMLFKSAPSVDAVHVPTAGAESEWESEYEKANLDAAARNALPDSAFAAVWTDAKGKKQRKLPIHDAGHLAAARGRIDAADIPASVKAAARRKIEAATKTKEKAVKKSLFKQMLGLFTETDIEKRKVALSEMEKAFPDDDGDEDDKDKDKGKDKAPVHKSDDEMCKCADCMSKRTAKSVAKSAEMVAIEKKQVELEKQNATLQAALNVEVEKRLDAEMVDILKQFKATPFDPATDVDIFRKMKRDNPEAFDRTIAVMKATDAQLTQSALYRNVGSSRSGAGEGSAWAQIEAKADSLIEKGAAGLTREQAIEKVMLDPKNNGLVKQYRAEQQ